MRRYIARIEIGSELNNLSTGAIGEAIFQAWFNNTFQGELLFKQKADRDYQKVDYRLCKKTALQNG